MSTTAEQNAILDAIMGSFSSELSAYLSVNKVSVNGEAITITDRTKGCESLVLGITNELVGKSTVFSSKINSMAQEIVQRFNDLGSPGLASFLALLAGRGPSAFAVMCWALTTVYCFDRTATSVREIPTYGKKTRDPWMHLVVDVLTLLEQTFMYPKPTNLTDTEKTLNKLPASLAGMCPAILKDANWSISGNTLMLVMLNCGKTQKVFQSAHEFFIKGSTAFGVWRSCIPNAPYSIRLQQMDYQNYSAIYPNSSQDEKAYAFVVQYLLEVQAGRNDLGSILRYGKMRSAFQRILNRARMSPAFHKAVKDKDAPAADAALGFLDSDGEPFYEEIIGEVRTIAGEESIVYTGLPLPAGKTVKIVAPGSKEIDGTNADLKTPSAQVKFSDAVQSAIPDSDELKNKESAPLGIEGASEEHAMFTASHRLAKFRQENPGLEEAAYDTAYNTAFDQIKNEAASETGIAPATPAKGGRKQRARARAVPEQ